MAGVLVPENTAYAVPVFGEGNSVIGAIAVVLPTAHENPQLILPVLVAAGRGLSRTMGAERRPYGTRPWLGAGPPGSRHAGTRRTRLPRRSGPVEWDLCRGFGDAGHTVFLREPNACDMEHILRQGSGSDGPGGRRQPTNPLIRNCHRNVASRTATTGLTRDTQ